MVRNPFKKSVDKRNKQFPIMEDYDDLSRDISAFRKYHDEYFSVKGLQENSSLQACSTQTFGNLCRLWKIRLNKFNILMKTHTDRRNFYGHRKMSEPKPIYEDKACDGRYSINNIREEITATRRFEQNGKLIGFFEYDEIASYLILSAQELSDNRMICPDCGAETTKDNLLDGCDFCGTKFLIEDLKNRFAHFSFTEDRAFRDKKQYGTPPFVQGLRSEYNVNKCFNDKHAEALRGIDDNFSFFDFETNVHNKIAMIHYADYQKQVNAFSDIDLSPVLELYKNVVGTDMHTFTLDIYDTEPPFEEKDGLMYVRTFNQMYIYVLEGKKIKKKTEIVRMVLVRNADCKTPSVHSPSVMKCKGCRTSLSLLDGKSCPACDREINLKESDWVIVRYIANIDNKRYIVE